MSNLTITVDDDVLKRARMRALENGVSVNAVLREFLEAYAGARRTSREAIADLLQLSQRGASRRGGRIWVRDQLHQRC